MIGQRKAKRGTTIVDVANALGVAPSTVSNALHDKALVAPATKARILAMAKAMNYEASAAARALVTRRSFSIGVLLPDFANPVFNEIIKGLNSVLSLRGYATLIASTESRRDDTITAIDAFMRRDVDGLVIISQVLESSEVERLSGSEIPTILVHRKPIDHEDRNPDACNFDYFGMDNSGGIASAVHHLAALGHRRIGFIAGPDRSSAAKERTFGYRMAVKDAGLDPDVRLVVGGNYEFISGINGAWQLLSLPERPTAIIAANDLMAFATMDVARQMNFAVPHDLSVIGVDDIFVSAFPMISLTTVRQPASEIGQSAGHRLLARIENEHLPPAMVALPADLIVRHSTAAVPEKVSIGDALTAVSLENYLTQRWKPTPSILP